MSKGHGAAQPRGALRRLAEHALRQPVMDDFGPGERHDPSYMTLPSFLAMDQIAEQVCRPEIESARSAVKRLAAEGLVEVRHIIRTRKSPARGVPDAKTHLRARLALDPDTRAAWDAAMQPVHERAGCPTAAQ